MRNLKIILVIFFISYFLYFVTDFFLNAPLIDIDNLEQNCGDTDESELCAGFYFLVYFIWTGTIPDFVPILCIFIFHHKNFR